MKQFFSLTKILVSLTFGNFDQKWIEERKKVRTQIKQSIFLIGTKVRNKINLLSWFPTSTVKRTGHRM